MQELAGKSFVERVVNVVLLGQPGVDKTHLAIALGVKAVDADSSVLFLTLETLMGRRIRAAGELPGTDASASGVSLPADSR